MKSWFSPGGGFDLSGGLRYRDFDIGNPECLHVVLSDRAYAAVIAQILRDGGEASGGVLLGSVQNRIWYIVDAAAPAPEDGGWTVGDAGCPAAWNGGLFRTPLRVLGAWRARPPRMDYFSPEDGQVLCRCEEGRLAMLATQDPELRLTFYYCAGGEAMPVEYDHGDAYVLEELLAYASPEELSARAGRPLRVKPHRDMDPEQLPRRLRPPAPAEGPAEAPAREPSPAEAPTADAARPEPVRPPSAAESEALVRELMRRLEDAMTRMPASWMVRLRDQNDQILAILEQLLREAPEHLPPEAPFAVPPPAPSSAPAAEGSGPPPDAGLPPEAEGAEVSGRINDLRVKYATEGGRRGWGV